MAADGSELEDLRRLLSGLRAELDQFEHRVSLLAVGDDRLSDHSRRRWEQALAAAAEATEAYDYYRHLLDPPSGRPPPLSTDARHRARQELNDALGHLAGPHEVVEQIAARHDDGLGRVSQARQMAEEVGAADVVEDAERLSARIRNDPFGDHKDRVVHLQLSAGRYAAEAFLDKLRARAAEVHDDVERAARGIAGFEPPPLPDVGELGERLERIERSNGTRSEQLAELNTWQHEADSAAQGLTDAAEQAGAMLARRERLRGRWKVLSRRADELDALEHPAIDAVRGPIRHQLETGRCHLDAVEGHLAELAKLLDEIEAGRP